jgi:hypothetical protein
VNQQILGCSGRRLATTPRNFNGTDAIMTVKMKNDDPLMKKPVDFQDFQMRKIFWVDFSQYSSDYS